MLRVRHVGLIGAMIGVPLGSAAGAWAPLVWAVLVGWTLSDVYRWNKRGG